MRTARVRKYKVHVLSVYPSLPPSGGFYKESIQKETDMTAASQIEFLIRAGAQESPHAHGRTLFEHFLGTRSLLERWGASKDVCAAGLFHAVYGTDRYKLKLLDTKERAAVREVIGEHAERLVFRFSNLHRPRELHAAVSDPSAGQELMELVEIECANVVDQTRGSSCGQLIADELAKPAAQRRDVFAAALRRCNACRDSRVCQHAAHQP